MADSHNDAVFWLPSKFLADDDVLLNKENAPLLHNNGLTKTELKPSLNFPTEFPYEFDSIDSALSSPVDSVVCSTEVESNNNTSDEDDFLAGLTRRLTHSSTQKLAVPRLSQDKLESWVMAGSPESTLSGIGSWSVSSNGSPNGSSLVSSPPTTPFGGQNDTWDLISAAAGQVARLKMNSEGVKYNNNNVNNVHGRGLLGAPKTPSPVHVVKNPTLGLYSSQNVNYNLGQTNQFQQFVKQEQMLKTRCGVVRGSQPVRPAWTSQPQPQQHQQIQNKARNIVYDNARCGRSIGLSQSAWPPLQVQHHQQHQPQPPPQQHKPVFLGGSGGVRRECTGTGVFLPRRYANNPPPDPRKKSGCSTVLVPAKVVQALNLNFDDMNGNGQAQQRFNSAFGPQYDALMARRSAVMTLQKQRSLRPDFAPLNHEIHLPQEWTY